MKKVPNALEILQEFRVDYRYGSVLEVGRGESPLFSSFCRDYAHANNVYEIAETIESGFDLVISFDEVCRIKNPKGWAYAMVRCAAYGGVVYVSAPMIARYSRGDLWRFTPDGLSYIFRSKLFKELYSFFETDGAGAAVIGRRRA